MCRCSTQPNALRPCFEISAVAVVVFALACLEKNQKKKKNNQKMNILAYICELALNYFSEAFC